MRVYENKEHIHMINGKKVRMISSGNPEDPLIIGLHGLGGSAKTFHEVGAYLKGFYLLTIDLPGHGMSEDLEEDFVPEYLIQWLDCLISRITQDPVDMMAHSWGATVALQYSSIYSHRVKRLMLLDGGYHDFKYKYNRDKILFESGQLTNKPFLCYEEEKMYYLDDFDNYSHDTFTDAVNAELENYIRTNKYIENMIEDLIIEKDGKYIWHARGSTALKALEMQFQSQSLIDFEKINAHVLLLYPDSGQEDMIARLEQIETFKNKLALQVKAYSNCGHMMHYDQPHKLVKDIRAYFAN